MKQTFSQGRSRVFLVIAAGLAFALGFSPFSSLPLSPAYAQAPADIARAFERFIVKIGPPDPGRPFVGSGVVVRGLGDRTIMATSLAVVAGLDRVAVVDSAGGRFTGTVALRSATAQLALVAVTGWTGPRVVDVDARSLKDQEPVVVVGFDRQSGGGAFIASRAAGPTRLVDELPPGFEGGPVVGFDHRVLGVAASLRGDVAPSAVILNALTSLAAPPAAGQPGTPGVPAQPQSLAVPRVAAGGLGIRSFPSGAEIYWAGQLLARTPTAIERREGVNPFRFSLTAHADVAMQVTVSPRTGPVYIVLPPLLPAGYGRTDFGRSRIREGITALAAGDGVTAARKFRQALESDYTLVELKVYTGLAYFLQGRLGDALTFLRDYVAAKSSGPFAMTAYALMGLSYERQDRPQDALTRYKLALRLHPALAQAPTTIPSEAEIRSLETSTKEQPGRPELSFRLGLAYEAKGRFREGMQAMKDALFALGPP